MFHVIQLYLLAGSWPVGNETILKKNNLKNSRVPFQSYFKWLWFQVFWESANLHQLNSESSRSQGLRVLFHPFWGGTYKIHVRYQAKYGKRSVCLVHPSVRDKRRVSEIDLSQPRHETAFWWRHNGLVTSQLTDLIKWPNHPLELIGIYVHINTNNKEFLTQRCRRSTNV